MEGIGFTWKTELVAVSQALYSCVCGLALLGNLV